MRHVLQMQLIRFEVLFTITAAHSSPALILGMCKLSMVVFCQPSHPSLLDTARAPAGDTAQSTATSNATSTADKLCNLHKGFCLSYLQC